MEGAYSPITKVEQVYNPLYMQNPYNVYYKSGSEKESACYNGQNQNSFKTSGVPEKCLEYRPTYAESMTLNLVCVGIFLLSAYFLSAIWKRPEDNVKGER